MSADPGFSYSAEVAAVYGADQIMPGVWGGPGSQLRYRIIVHGPSGDAVFDNVTPFQTRYPDAIDTIAARVGSPVGIGRRGNVWYFLVDEKPRIDEECV